MILIYMKKGIISLIIFILILAGGFFYFTQKGQVAQQPVPTVQPATAANEPTDRRESIEIVAKSTFGELMAKAGIKPAEANEIYEEAKKTYDLVRIKAGHFLELAFDKNSNEFKELVYKIDSEDELVVKRQSSQEGGATSTAKSVYSYTAEIRPIKYEVKIVTKEGEVKTSMYEAAIENNVDERAIIALADAFQWSIDFSMDPRVGDKFKFIYEERYLDGKYQMPGKVLSGQYINDGKKYQVFYFEETADNTGYFDENGNSVQKMFLKAPVAFKYVSSGFTTGLRYVEAFNVSTGHRAVDYAATYGAPIRSVGNGTVVSAGWNGAYGKMVSIRHNGTYQTNYGHMSKVAVKRGAKVNQGDVIGYVGSTGFSTGPHVHYEMVKNGVKINPMQEVLPPGQPIKTENRDRFFTAIKEWQEALGR